MNIEIERVVISGDGISQEEASDLARHVASELPARLSGWDGPSASIEHMEAPGVAWDADPAGLARGIADGVVAAVKR